ncbi:30S ribosomal protein S16 [Candidatus Azoamicus ciliaticola]|uniref:Small ribosomal subunit protein bS16 n=1 Tax=Candidatus Azoamicus ciliaticola TaxID=2652803 RepID=A0A6J5JW43_9GAMM|nr:30S ribosomal protein S16 [Candidatus Azoamicus ciliaticola]CAB3976234.1 30S ribosomal protein S16 [Candidatus Azoamicus ciliaticola]
MVTIKLKRIGRKKKPFYNIIAIEKLKYIKGKYIEKLGYFNPIKKSLLTKINIERINYWSSKGAEISKRVQTLIKKYKNNDI